MTPAMLAAYRKALEPFAEWSRSLRELPNNLGPSCPLSIEPEAGPVIIALAGPRSPGRTKCVADLHEAEAILQSPDPGKALLDEHAAELANRNQQIADLNAELEAHATDRVNQRAEVAALRQRAEAAERDTARLDWLEQFLDGDFATRASIDRMMKDAPAGELPR